MGSKNFKNTNPAEKITSAGIEPKAAEPKKELEEKKPTSEKKKGGRPKTKDVKGTCKNINVAVPIVLLNKWEEVKIVHGSNLTEYITKLIKKDMDSNYEKYKSIADSLKNI